MEEDLQTLNDRNQRAVEEQRQILGACAKFTVFAQKHAVIETTSDKDTFHKRLATAAESVKESGHYKQLLEEYEIQVDNVKTDETTPPQAGDVLKTIDELKAMPLYRPMFSSLVEEVEAADKDADNHLRTDVHVITGSGSSLLKQLSALA